MTLVDACGFNNRELVFNKGLVVLIPLRPTDVGRGAGTGASAGAEVDTDAKNVRKKRKGQVVNEQMTLCYELKRMMLLLLLKKK